MNITINKNEYGFVEEDQCQQIIKEITGGTVSEARGPIDPWMIDEEVLRVRPIGDTIFTSKHGTELIRLPNGGFHIYQPDQDTDNSSRGGDTKFADTHTAFVWAMHHGLVSTIDGFTRAVDRAMCHGDAKLLSLSNGPMSHKMELAQDVFRTRVNELLDLKAYRSCAILIDDKVRTIDITKRMAPTIEQLCRPQGEDYGMPSNDVNGFPHLNSLREDIEETQIGELVTNSESCYFATNCASSAWDFPSKMPRERASIWCVPIGPIGKVDIEHLAMGAVTLCVLAEAWLTVVEWPEWVIDRATRWGRKTAQQQCAVSPRSPNVFSMENLYNEEQ